MFTVDVGAFGARDIRLLSSYVVSMLLFFLFNMCLGVSLLNPLFLVVQCQTESNNVQHVYIYIFIYLGNSNPHSLPIPSVPQCRANVRSSNPSCGWQRPWLSDRVADGYGSSERAISSLKRCRRCMAWPCKAENLKMFVEPFFTIW